MDRILAKFTNFRILKLFPKSQFSLKLFIGLIFVCGVALGFLAGNSTHSPQLKNEGPSHKIKGILATKPYFNVFDFIKQGFANEQAGIKWTELAEDNTSGVELVSIEDSMPMHIHKGEDHYTYVIAGRGEYIQNGTIISLEPGKFILTPMDTTHEVKNLGEEPILLLVFSSPEPFNEENIEWISTKK